MTLLSTLLAAEGPNEVHLPADINEVYWGSIAFFVIFGLFWWRGRPALAKAMADRTARIEAELASAKSERQAAEAALSATTSDLPDIGEEADRIRAEAGQTAAKLKEDLVAKAHAEADAVLERGKSDVMNRKRQAQADLTAEVARMTRDAAEAVVLEGLGDGNSQNDLIEKYINQVSGMS